MPVPQLNLLFVEQAGQPVAINYELNGQDARPTIKLTLCGTGRTACCYQL